jgi:biotin carboxylase
MKLGAVKIMIMEDKRKVIISVHTKLSDNEIGMIKKFGYFIAYIGVNISMDEIIKIDYPFEDNENTIQSTKEIINKIANKFNIQRIFTMDEYYIELVAQMAEELNIQYWGLDKEAVNNCRNKKETKKVFDKHKVPNAKYMLIKSPREVLSIMKDIPFPLVVKPSNESGSRLVFICNGIQQMIDSVTEIYEAVGRNRGHKIDNEVLVEEYLQGDEYSVETYTINGISKVLAITSKETDNCVEISHTVPAKLDSKIAENIENNVINALKALNVKFGVTHTELKLTEQGVKIIEVNGRPAGDNIHKLVKSVTGINIRELSLSIALDGSINNLTKVNPYAKSATVRYFTSDKDGTFSHNPINKIDSDVELDIYYESGQVVNKTIDNFSRLGYFIVYSTDSEYSKDKATDIILKVGANVK